MTRGFTIVFNKERDVRRWVQNLKQNSERAFDNALTDVAHSIETQAIKNLNEGFKKPHGLHGGAIDSGRLASGFVVEDEKFRKVVGNRVRYAAHMEYGTGPAIGRPKYRPPEKRIKGWAEAKSKRPADVADSIWKYGTQPRRYLGRAVHQKKKDIGKRVAKNLATLKRMK